MEHNFIETIVNVETGETTTRNYTQAEIDEVLQQQAKIVKAQAEAEAKAAEKAALLEKLGISEDEAKLLLG